MSDKSTLFNRANSFMRRGKYGNAIALYRFLMERSEPRLREIFEFNLRVAEGRARRSAAGLRDYGKPKNLDKIYYDLIIEGGYFDFDWYVETYGAEHDVNGNPLEHYIQYGVNLSTNPSANFDTAYYLRTHTDVADAGIHPLLHYASNGNKEGRSVYPDPASRRLEVYFPEPPEYVARTTHDNFPKVARVIAFYLPQFHPIPENDLWWGNGFTEWTNVQPATPQFEGHYQPHVPDEYLGYYDLRDVRVMKKQVALAKEYGIEGFCFYTYWFSGRRLLETPVDNYLADTTLDLPFCICWANENWSRRWDGRDQELLIEQRYSDEDDVSFISHMSKYLRDPRYIKVDGRPLLVIYRPNLFPDMRATAHRWRAWCKENGLGDIFIAYVQSFEKVSPYDYGLDAAIEFPPNNSSPPDITHKIVNPEAGFSGKVYDWRIFLQRSEEMSFPEYEFFPGVCPSWDNTARRKGNGTVFANYSPRLFQRWLERVFVRLGQHEQNPDRRLVFVNAWNEWAEGAHLEPDQRYGYAWLEAVRKAHVGVSRHRPPILLVSHDAHPHGAQLLCLNMARELTERLNFQVHMIVLGDGVLLSKYSQYAEVERLKIEEATEDEILRLLQRLSGRGVSSAIVNTTVSGSIVPYLKRVGLKVVSLVHELPGILHSYQLESHANEIENHSDYVVFAAEQVRSGFEQFLGKRLRQGVIRPQGLYQRSWLRAGADKQKVRESVRRDLQLPTDSKLVLCVGYADHRKGFDLFMEVMAILVSKRDDVYGVWVGHLDEHYVKKVLTGGCFDKITSRVRFTGLVEEPQPYYLAADVYALTSREDPFPSVVLESLDSFTPVVAFRGSGGFEGLLERGCGVLAQKENVGELAAAIDKILDDPNFSNSLSKTGMEIVERELNFRHYVFDLLRLCGSDLPRVSVVVPNYNYAHHIEKRLSTVCNQVHPIYELIIMDDCSSDNSVELIRNFLVHVDVPYVFNINEKNSGSVFNQWIKGVGLARGDYVWIAEADDVCKPELLTRILELMIQNDAVFGFCDSWQIDNEDQVIGGSYKTYMNVGDSAAFNHDFVMGGIEFLRQHLSVRNVVLNASAVVFKRKALEEVLRKIARELEDFHVAGDWRVYVELCARDENVVYVSDALNGHRRHGNSVTHRLHAEKHIAEIKKVHTCAAHIVNGGGLLEKQKHYLESISGYLIN